MSECGKKTSGPLGLGVSTCVRASWHDGECRPWLTSDERDEAELATLRADLARVKAERDGLADGLTIANNAAERRGRERDAACAQVRELQRVARAADVLSHALEDEDVSARVGIPAGHLAGILDALPPSMLEEVSVAHGITPSLGIYNTVRQLESCGRPGWVERALGRRK